MEVAVLQPHDCLKSSYPHRRRRSSSAVNSTTNPNGNSNRSNRKRPNGPSKAQQSRPKSPPVMGQVRILKRGEQLSSSLPVPPVVMPEPEINQSEPGPFLHGFYAGSACITSPSPSEVPLPGFFWKKTGGEAHNQVIASELRRVLKLV